MTSAPTVVGFVGLDDISFDLATSLLRFGYIVKAFHSQAFPFDIACILMNKFSWQHFSFVRVCKFTRDTNSSDLKECVLHIQDLQLDRRGASL
ncbi:uncharacterized protein LOC141633237 isoform X2 [Silene latifolia]